MRRILNKPNQILRRISLFHVREFGCYADWVFQSPSTHLWTKKMHQERRFYFILLSDRERIRNGLLRITKQTTTKKIKIKVSFLLPSSTLEIHEEWSFHLLALATPTNSTLEVLGLHENKLNLCCMWKKKCDSPFRKHYTCTIRKDYLTITCFWSICRKLMLVYEVILWSSLYLLIFGQWRWVPIKGLSWCGEGWDVYI